MAMNQLFDEIVVQMVTQRQMASRALATNLIRASTLAGRVRNQISWANEQLHHVGAPENRTNEGGGSLRPSCDVWAVEAGGCEGSSG
jgi:hypothetical protein